MKKKMRKISVLQIVLLAVALVSAAIAPCEAAVKPFTAAALQFNPVLNERDKNIDALAEAVGIAAQHGAKLIVAPEMSTTGYQYGSREEIAPYTDTIPGVATAKIGEVAKKYGVYVVFGMAERDADTDLYYNSAAFVGPEGYIGKYRKSHQWETEEHWAAWGDLGVPVYDTQLGKIAINICMDATYFESARLAGLGGADILAFPTNSTAQAMWALQSRAVHNGMFIIAANRSNTELDYHMIGASAIWSPEGDLLVSAKILPDKKDDIDEANAVYAVIDPSKYDNVNKRRFTERRPELYKDIALHISPWNYKATEKSQNVCASVVQYAPIASDKKRNMGKIETLLSNRKLRSLDVIVLPEYSLTGAPRGEKEAVEFAEAPGGESSAFYAKLAKEIDSYVVGSVIEKRDDKLYIKALLISPDGAVAGEYAKTHLNALEKNWAEPGSSLGVFSTPAGRLGIMFGSESVFPEMAGLLAVKRVDMIAVPSSWRGEYGAVIDKDYKLSQNPYPKNAMCLFDAVALTSQAYTLVAGFAGGTYKGGSGKYALDPLYGLDKVELLDKEEEALCVKFDTLQRDWWFNQERLIGGRSPLLYKPIISSKNN